MKECYVTDHIDHLVKNLMRVQWMSRHGPQCNKRIIGFSKEWLRFRLLLWVGRLEWQPLPVVKKVIRLDVPVEKFPNFVGRILGPHGNSLKRIEAMTECRIFIRGRGSVKDTVKEEKLKDKPGYEHLNDPLHLLLETEFPEDIIDSRLDHAVGLLENLLKPVDESMDTKRRKSQHES